MDLSRYWPLAILLLALTGCGDSSTERKSAAEWIESGQKALAEGNFNQAISDFTSAKEAQPDSAQAWERRAAAYLQMKKFDQAMSDCEEALKIDGKFATAFFTRGLVEKELDKQDNAIEDFTKALGSGLDRVVEVMVLVARGTVYHSQANACVKSDEAAKILQKALKDFDRAIEIDPRQAELHMQHAAIQLDSGDYENAVADCDKALEIKPSLAGAYVVRARAQCELGEFDHAVGDCDAAVHRNEKLVEAYVIRAKARLGKAATMRTLADVAECEKAATDLQTALGLLSKPQDDLTALKQTHAMRAQTRELCGFIYHNLGITKKALAEYEKALGLDPNLVSTLLRRAETRWAANDYSGALSDCNTVLGMDSARPDAYCCRGMAYTMKGDFSKALEDFKQAVSLDHKCAKGYTGRANINLALASSLMRKAKAAKDPREIAACQEQARVLRRKSIEDANSAIQVSRHSASAYLPRALAYAAEQEMGKALADFNAAIREDPKMAKAFFNRGVLFATQGRLEDAIRDFKEASRLNPRNAECDRRLALIYKALGNNVFALDYMKKAEEKTRKQGGNADEDYVKPKRVPQSEPDVELDPLDKAQKALEKKLDAIVQQQPA